MPDTSPARPLPPRRTPQVIVTLSPQGGLVVELPGANGGRHRVELRHGAEGEDLRRILEAQLGQRCQLGEDGSPTQAQVKHWEQHGVFADERCPFCIAEGRTTGPKRQRQPRAVVLTEWAGVKVRRVRHASEAKATSSSKSADALGL